MQQNYTRCATLQFGGMTGFGASKTEFPSWATMARKFSRCFSIWLAEGSPDYNVDLLPTNRLQLLMKIFDRHAPFARLGLERFRPAARTGNLSATGQICLLMHDEVLVHLGSGRYCGLTETDDCLHLVDPDRLAEGARNLLADGVEQTITLALPSHEFVATQLSLPGIAAKDLANAARYQTTMLLPGAEPLLLAIHPNQADAPEHVALWLPVARAEALYQAFAARGLRLADIIPRPLAAVIALDGHESIQDQDATTFTQIEWQGRAIRNWWYLPLAEYHDPTFQAQLGTLAPPTRTLACLDDWRKLPALSPAIPRAYGLVPPGAQSERAQAQRQIRRRLWWSLAGVAAFLLLVAIAALYRYEYRLERDVRNLRATTRDVSQLRAEVFEIEERYAPILQFPQQNVASLLQTMDTLIPKDSHLTALRLEDGAVEIEGYSPNPTVLLEALSRQQEFIEVKFSCDIQSEPGRADMEKFCIHFFLAGIDVPGYLQQFFPANNE